MKMTMREKQRVGRRYIAGLIMLMAVLFFIAGSLGPARHSPYFIAIVPVPAVIAFALGWRAWSSERHSTFLSAAALLLLILVLFFSHLLPRPGA